MRFANWILLLLLTGCFAGAAYAFPSFVHAQAQPTNSFITIVNPVRGNEFWQLKNQTPATGVINSYQTIAQNNLPATWLLRYDAFADPQIMSTVKQFNANQEIGLFLEITPTLAKAAGVPYHQTETWHNAGSVLLTGYSPDDRKKLIDTVMAKYQQTFGHYPQSVGAWWIDANSLQYMKDHYQIITAMIVADQYSTDSYQSWGQYWGTPYYPSKSDALMPAESAANAITVPLIQWANRDPYNGYGSSVYESTYSVQVNDYMIHGLGADYFKKLLDIYVGSNTDTVKQITVGLENDFSWQQYGKGYTDQISVVNQYVKNGTAQAVTMATFGQNFNALQNGQNTVSIVSADDPLGGTDHVVWYMSPYYRVGWFSSSKGSVIRDMRVYSDGTQEPCLTVACDNLDFAYTDPNALDEVTYGDDWVLDQGAISNLQIKQNGDNLTISYKNKIGNTRTITFLPHDVSVDGQTHSASESILNAIKADQSGNQKIQPQNTAVSFPFQRIAIGAFTFLLFVLFLLYLPARTILRIANVPLDLEREWLVAIPLGVSMLTVLAYLFGFLHLGIWYFILLLVLAGYGILRYPIRPHFARPSNESVITICLIIIGSLCVSIVTLRNGLPMRYGLGFWGPNGHDAIWHLALIEALIKHIPTQNPMYANIPLKNYHYFFDIFAAEAVLLTRADVLDVFFRFIPVLIAICFGGLIYTLTWFLGRSKAAANAAVAIAYTTGSFGWIAIRLLHLQNAGSGESLFWSTQAASLLLNPPFAISVVMLLAGLVLLMLWLKTKEKKLLLPIIILLGALIEFKVYAAIVLIGGLGLVGIYECIKQRSWKTLALSIGLLLINICFYLPNTQQSQDLLVFSPFWMIHAMVDSPDRLYWQRLTLARVSGSHFKFFAAELIGLSIFLIGNLGIRVLGVVELVRNWRNNINFSTKLLLSFIAAIGIILPLLFIQKGTNWNTIQFFYYTIIMFVIFTGLALQWLFQKMPNKILQYAVIAIIVAIGLPTSIATWQDYFPERAPARLPYPEMTALNFLKQQPEGVVLTYPYSDKLINRYAEPRPLFAYTSTGYVAAFSGHPSYLEDTMNNSILGLDTTERQVGQEDIFKAKDPTFIHNFLAKNKIKYIYLPTGLQQNLDENLYGVKNIYSTFDVNIYKVL